MKGKERTLNDIKADIIALVEEAEELLGNTVDVDIWTTTSSNNNPYTTSLPRLLSRDRHITFRING